MLVSLSIRKFFIYKISTCPNKYNKNPKQQSFFPCLCWGKIFPSGKKINRFILYENENWYI